jgi:hypothetical protein
MTQPLRPNPTDFQRCVRFLCSKIESIVLRAGLSDVDCRDLHWSLAAMPPIVRDRVRLMLTGIEIQTEHAEPVLAFATRYLLILAQDIWAANPHPVTHRSGALAPRRTIN